MVAVEYHDDLKEVQADAPLARLLASPHARAPFDRLEWWQGLARECSILPLIAVARDGERRIALPLRRVGRRIEALANWYNFSVRPIASPGTDNLDLLATLAEDLAGEAPHIVLSPLPDEDGETTRLAAAFRKAGWTVFREACDTNHVLPVAGRSFAEFLADRPGPLRTTLKRKAARVVCTIETHFNPESWQAYEEIYAQSWKPSEGNPAFLRRFAEQEGKAGRLRLGLARAEGRPVATQFWTVESGTAFIHKLAHLEEAKPLSPGTSLSAAMFEQVIDHDRVSMVDFGTGDNPYKRDWMDCQRPRYRLEMFRPGWPGNWPAIARRVASHLVQRSKRG